MPLRVRMLMNTAEAVLSPARSKALLTDINGILLLDKAIGITSNKALQQVKYLFGAKKAGHTGNLDPFASGMLPICFGEATKFAGLLLEADKSYLGTAKLGERSDTADCDGKIIQQRPVPDLHFATVEQALLKFCGKLQQLPPMFSALKHKGQPLYKLARQGIEVPRQPREISIYKIELLEYQAPNITFKVECSKGTYVRTLVDDLGEDLGCGAHVTALRRLQVGHYSIEHCHSFADLSAIVAQKNQLALLDLLMPTDSAVVSWSTVVLSSFAVHCLLRGQNVTVADAPQRGQVKLIAASNGNFIGIGQALGDGVIAPKRLVNTATIT